MFAIIDAGGTTFKCAVANEVRTILCRKRIPTLDPGAVIANCVDFFRTAERDLNQEIIGMGLACFGPLDVDETSPTYGAILNTPKPGWTDVNLKNAFEEALGVPVCIDTDVNAALLAEAQLGAASGARRAAYVTVGTGIGVSFIQDGVLIAKPYHSEFGHIFVERHPNDTYPGACKFHVACLEGLASAKSFEARWGPAEDVAKSHEAWSIEADYLAQLCSAISLLLRPEKVVLGGGLLQADGLIELVRDQFSKKMNGYLGHSEADIARLIVRPQFGDDAGLMGAYQIALPN